MIYFLCNRWNYNAMESGDSYRKEPGGQCECSYVDQYGSLLHGSGGLPFPLWGLSALWGWLLRTSCAVLWETTTASLSQPLPQRVRSCFCLPIPSGGWLSRRLSCQSAPLRLFLAHPYFCICCLRGYPENDIGKTISGFLTVRKKILQDISFDIQGSHCVAVSGEQWGREEYAH